MYVGLKPGFLHKVFTRMATLRESTTDLPVPCEVTSIEVTNENTIPQEPVDSNLMVSDTIVKKPYLFSLELHVYEEDAKEFFRIISEIQTGTHGFTLTDRMGQEFHGLYYTQLSYTETHNKQGAFDCHLELREVIRVTALASVKGRPVKPPEGTPTNKGTTSAQPVEKQQEESMAYQLLSKGKEIARDLGAPEKVLNILPGRPV